MVHHAPRPALAAAFALALAAMPALAQDSAPSAFGPDRLAWRTLRPSMAYTEARDALRGLGFTVGPDRCGPDGTPRYNCITTAHRQARCPQAYRSVACEQVWIHWQRRRDGRTVVWSITGQVQAPGRLRAGELLDRAGQDWGAPTRINPPTLVAGGRRPDADQWGFAWTLPRTRCQDPAEATLILAFPPPSHLDPGSPQARPAPDRQVQYATFSVTDGEVSAVVEAEYEPRPPCNP